MMMMNRIYHPRSDIDRLNIPRMDGGRESFMTNLQEKQKNLKMRSYGDVLGKII